MFAKGDNVNVFVTRVKGVGSECRIWAQTDFDGYAQLETLMQRLEGDDGLSSAGNTSLHIGDVCVAKYAEDGAWYRAQVTDIDKREGKAQVIFIDFGNSESVALQDVKNAPSPEYMRQPPMAAEYVLGDFMSSDGIEWTAEELEYLQENLCNTEFPGVVLHAPCVGRPPVVRLWESKGSDKLLVDSFVQERVGRKVSAALVKNAVISIPVPPQATHEVFVTYSVSALDFWVQFVDRSAALDAMHLQIETAMSNQTNPVEREQIHPGKLCLARYSETGDFYRSIISWVDEKKSACALTYIDFGNTETVAFSQLFAIPGEFTGLPSQAVHCCLNGKDVGKSNFNAIVEQDSICIRSVSVMESGTHIVEFASQASPSKNIPAELAASPVAHQTRAANHANGGLHKYRPVQFDLATLHDVCISHLVADTGVFYCQLLENAEMLDNLMIKLQQVQNLSHLGASAAEGMPCIVQSAEDGNYYRGQVTKSGSKEVWVKYVDFGLEVVANPYNVFGLSEDLIGIPVQAFVCTLSGSEAVPVEQITKVLKKYYSTQALKMKVLFKTTQAFEVELYDVSSARDYKLSEIATGEHGECEEPVQSTGHVQSTSQAVVSPANVATGELEAVFVIAAVSDTDFFAQLAKYPQDDLDFFQQKLNAYYKSNHVPVIPNPKVGSYCCAVFAEDGLFYRAKVQSISNSKVSVSFVDYGNQDTVNEVMVLLPQFCSLPQQGSTFSLSQHYPGVTRTLIETVLLEKEIKVQVKNQTGEVQQVVLPVCEKNQEALGALEMTRKKVSPPRQMSRQPSRSSSERFEFKEPSLTLGQCQDVFVSHSNGPDQFYCQLVSSETELNSLMDDIEVYTTKVTADQAVQSPGLGDAVIAQYSADKGWYRSRVTGVLRSGCVEVMFVDYGNSEKVKLSALRAMKPDFIKLPIQAVVCGLDGMLSSSSSFLSDTDISQFLQLVDSKNLEAQFIAYEPSKEHYRVHLFDNSNNLNLEFGKLTGKLDPSYKDPNNPPAQPQPAETALPTGARAAKGTASPPGKAWAKGFEESERNSAERSVLSTNRGSRGVEEKSGVASKTGFKGAGRSEWETGRPHPLSRDVEQLTEESSTEAPEARGRGSQGMRSDQEEFRTRTQETDIKPMDLADKEYVDAYVMYALSPSRFYCHLQDSEEQITILMEAINLEYGSLKPGAHVMRTPSHSQLCCALFSEDSLWYRARILNVGGDKAVVEFVDYGNQEEVPLTSIRELQAKFLKLPAQAFQCSLHGVAPLTGSDWTQASNTKFQELAIGPEEGKKLVAAIIERTRDNTYVVELIDISTPIHELMIKAGVARSIESPLEMTTRKGQRRLSGTSSASTSSRASSSSKVSNSTSADGKLRELSLPTNSFVDVNVTFVTSPSDFWCQLTSQSSDLNRLMTRIGDMYTKLPPGELDLAGLAVSQVCCAKFSEDESWYRASVLSIDGNRVHVKFIDYGNDEWLSVSSIRQLKKHFMELPVQAVWCSLQAVPLKRGAWSDEAIRKFEDSTWEKNLVAKIVGKSPQGSNMVQLIDERDGKSVNLAQELVDQGLASRINSNASHGGSSDTQMDRNTTQEHAQPAERPAPGRSIKNSSPPKTQRTAEPDRMFKNMPLEFGEPYRVAVSWMYDPLDFYVQIENTASQLVVLTEELFEYYQRLKLNDQAIQNAYIGQTCVAYYAEDGSWYRGIISKLRDNEAMVQYVDYGNRQKVPLSKVKQIQPQFMGLPPQGIRCSLKGLQAPDGPWDASLLQRFTKATGQPLICTFHNPDKNLHPVDLKPVGAAATSILDDLQLVREPAVEDKQAAPRTPRQSPVKALQPTETRSPSTVYPAQTIPSVHTQAYVSHTITPTDFYIQPVKQDSGLTRLAESLHAEYEALGDGDRVLAANPVVGMTCCAKFSEDDFWYRSKVVSVEENNQVTVYFVDYGNTDTVGMDRLRSLAQEYLVQPPYAFACRLKGVLEPKQGWLQANVDRFAKATGEGEKAVEVTFYTKNAPYEVGMLDGDHDLSSLFTTGFVSGTGARADANEDMVTSKEMDIPEDSLVHRAAKVVAPRTFPARPAASGDMQVYLSNVDNPSKFFVQVADEYEGLNSIVAQMEEFQQQGSIGDAKVGQACAGIFEGAWYRATLTQSISNREVKVLFVDYGNSEVVEVSQLSSLTPDLLTQPPFAIECSLEDVEKPPGGWPEGTAEKFLGCGGEGEKELRATFKTSIEPCQLVLRDDALDINQVMRDAVGEIKQQEEVAETPSADADPESQPGHFPQMDIPTGDKCQVFVSHVEDIGQIYLHLTKDTVAIEELLDKVDEKYNSVAETDQVVQNPETGTICCVKYSEDSVWYRGIVENVVEDKAQVRFVDYGNKDEVPLSGLKRVSEDLRSIPVMCFQCSLYGAPADCEALKEVGDKLVELTSEKGLTAELMTRGQPCLVRLWDKEENVNRAALGDSYVEYSLPKESQDEQLAEAGGQAAGGQAASAQGEIVPNKYKLVSLPNESQVYVSAVETASQFFVQLVDQDDKLREFTKSLNEHYKEADVNQLALTSKSVGQICCARYVEDNTWCRAVITGSGTAQEWVVLFVDYGNFDTVATKDLFRIEKAFLDVPPFAIECTLAGAPSICAWTEEEVDAFAEAIQEKELLVKVHGKTEPYPIDLYDGDENLGPKLFPEKITEVSLRAGQQAAADTEAGRASSDDDEEEDDFKSAEEDNLDENELRAEAQRQVEHTDTRGLGAGDETKSEPPSMALYKDPRSLLASQKSEVYITHIVSPSQFWCQLASMQSKVQELGHSIGLNAGEASAAKAVSRDQLVAVRCDDEEWCRARVLRRTDTDAKVFYLDYGEQSTQALSEVYELEEQFVSMPPQAVECVLSGVQARDTKWTEEAVARFEELVLEKKLLMIIDMVADGCHSDADSCFVVRLLDMGISVTKRLIEEGHGLDCHTTSYPNSRESSVEKESKSFGSPLSSRESSTDRDVLCTASEGEIETEMSSGVEPEEARHLGAVEENAPAATEETPEPQKDEETAPSIDEIVHREKDFDTNKPVVDLEHDAAGMTTADADSAVELGEVAEEKEKSRFQAVMPDGESDVPRLGRIKVETGVTLDATVCHVESPSQFWVQLRELDEQLEELGEQLQDFYQNNQVVVDQLELGGHYVAQSVEDNTWYRARVLSTDEQHQQVTVQYADYGNTETLGLSRLQPLTGQFRALPSQVVECILEGVRSPEGAWSPETVETFVDITSDKVLTAEFVSMDADDVAMVRLQDKDGMSISQHLLDSKIAVDSAKTTFEVPTEALTTTSALRFKSPDMEEGEVVEVYVSVADTPQDFWCQLAQTSDKDFPLLQDLVQDVYSGLAADENSLGELEPGMPCVAQFGADKVWYRAEIIEVGGASVQALFVDYGSQEEVPRGTGQLKSIHADLLNKLPQQAFRCTLSQIKSTSGDGDQWDEASCNRFQELVMYEESKGFSLHALTVSRDDYGSIIQVQCGLKDQLADIAQQLVDGGYAQWREGQPRGEGVQGTDDETVDEALQVDEALHADKALHMDEALAKPGTEEEQGGRPDERDAGIEEEEEEEQKYEDKAEEKEDENKKEKEDEIKEEEEDENKTKKEDEIKEEKEEDENKKKKEEIKEEKEEDENKTKKEDEIKEEKEEDENGKEEDGKEEAEEGLIKKEEEDENKEEGEKEGESKKEEEDENKEEGEKEGLIKKEEEDENKEEGEKEGESKKEEEDENKEEVVAEAPPDVTEADAERGTAEEMADEEVRKALEGEETEENEMVGLTVASQKAVEPATEEQRDEKADGDRENPVREEPGEEDEEEQEKQQVVKVDKEGEEEQEQEETQQVVKVDKEGEEEQEQEQETQQVVKVDKEGEEEQEQEQETQQVVKVDKEGEEQEEEQQVLKVDKEEEAEQEEQQQVMKVEKEGEEEQEEEQQVVKVDKEEEAEQEEEDAIASQVEQIVTDVIKNAKAQVEAEKQDNASGADHVDTSSLCLPQAQSIKDANRELPEDVPGATIGIGRVMRVVSFEGASSENFTLHVAKVKDGLALSTDRLDNPEEMEDGQTDKQVVVSVGQTCLAPNPEEDGKWCPAQVTALEGDNVQVLFVATGATATVGAGTVQEPPSETNEHCRTQTLACKLAGVSAEVCSDASFLAFTELCEDKQLTAHVVSQLVDGRYEVYLYDTKDCSGVSVNQQLVDLGHAILTHPDTSLPPHPDVDSFSDFSDFNEEDTVKDQLENSFLEVSVQRNNSFGDLAEHEVDFISEDQAYAQLKYQVDDQVELFVASAKDPDNLICHPVETSEELDNLMERLGVKYSDDDIPALNDPQIGQPCCARYTKDELWYRAEVISLAGAGTIQVYYVDYGNVEMVTLDRVRLLEQKYLVLPAQALRCSVAAVRPAAHSWTEEVTEVLEGLCCGSSSLSLTAKVTAVEDDCRITAHCITCTGEDIGQVLLDQGLAVPETGDGQQEDQDEGAGGQQQQQQQQQVQQTEVAAQVRVRRVEAGTKLDVFLSHCVSPAQLWCQVDTDQLNALMSQINGHYRRSTEAAPTLKEGDVCVAQYSVDQRWYRAQVLSAYGGHYAVQFVDYGNGETSTPDQLRPLLAKFAEQPAFAIECSIYGIRPIDGENWSKDCVESVMSYADMPFMMKVKDTTFEGVPKAILVSRRGTDLAEVLVSERLAQNEPFVDDEV